jgi:hypothetical protein
MWRAAAFATAGEVSGSTTASHSRRDLSLVRPTCRGADRIECDAYFSSRRFFKIRKTQKSEDESSPIKPTDCDENDENAAKCFRLLKLSPCLISGSIPFPYVIASPQ